VACVTGNSATAPTQMVHSVGAAMAAPVKERIRRMTRNVYRFIITSWIPILRRPFSLNLGTGA
jgi:hypothetical protein